MKVLGLGAFRRDSAAALVVGDRLVSFEREERYSRKPHDANFPRRAAHACLERAGVAAHELDALVFFEEPIRAFQRVLASEVAAFPAAPARFVRELAEWLGERLWVHARIAEELDVDPDRVRFCDHLSAHAFAAYHDSGFEDAAIWIADDAGGWSTSCLARGQGAGLEILEELSFPHSPVALEVALARRLGIDLHRDPGALDALASGGEPRLRAGFERLLPGWSRGTRAPVLGGGYEKALRGAWNERLAGESNLGGPRAADVASSWLRALELHGLEAARRLAETTGSTSLCIGGRVALRSTLVTRICAEGPFERVHAPSEPDDAGAVVGAALWAAQAAPSRVSGDARTRVDAAVVHEVAARLQSGGLVAWLDERPVVLGERAFAFASPCAAESGARLRRALGAAPNEPARALVRAASADREFELPRGCRGALRSGRVVVRTPQRLRASVGETLELRGIEAELDPDLHALLEAHERASGAGWLLATPFRMRGQAAVFDERTALRTLSRSSVDALVAGGILYERDGLREVELPFARRATTKISPASGSFTPSRNP